jgi:hypothetical protein
MSSHRAVFHFGIAAVDVSGDALGRRWEFERDGARVVLSLPSAPDSFGSHVTALIVAAWNGDRETAVDENRVRVAAVTAFEVAVDVDAAVSSTDPGESEIDLGQAALDAAFPVALSVATDFISWLRVHAERFRLGASHEPPEVLDGFLTETSSERRVRNISFSPRVHIVGFRLAGLTVEVLDEVADLLKVGAVVGDAELLLADAREALASPGVEQEWEATRRDVRRAILLAAIASEVKIKGTLLEKTPDDRRSLVEIILKNFRVVEVAVGDLPHKTMKAAIGRSLHEDNPALFDAVKKLFTDRNAIAHRGEPPELPQARRDVQAAVDLFAWLDTLPAP